MADEPKNAPFMLKIISKHECNARANVNIEGINAKGEKEIREGYTYILNLKRNAPQPLTVESAIKEKKDLTQASLDTSSTPLAQGLSNAKIVNLKKVFLEITRGSEFTQDLKNSANSNTIKLVYTPLRVEITR